MGETGDTAGDGKGEPPPSRPAPAGAGRDGGRTRKDVVLRRLAMRTVLEESERRGTRFSETLRAIIHEWRLLGRVAAAQQFRADMREDLREIRLAAAVAATAHGPARDAALKTIHHRADEAVNRLVLVTVL